MLRKLLDIRPAVVAPVFDRAAAILDSPVLSFDVPDTDGSRHTPNDVVQISVFLANHAHWQILRSEGIDGNLSLGLSLGEYNHLVHIGALEFDDALRLVAARGRTYESGPRGSMAALFPVSEEEVRDAIRRVAHPGVLEIATFNAPSQQVVAGDRAGVDAVARIVEEEHAATAVVTEERLPMHCSLFAPVAERLQPALEAAPFSAPRLPYLPNVLGEFCDEPAPDVVRSLLTAHVWRPVRFRHSIDCIANRFDDMSYVEVGPRSVIFNLLGKKWRSFRRFRTDADPEVFDASLDAAVRQLRNAA